MKWLCTPIPLNFLYEEKFRFFNSVQRVSVNIKVSPKCNSAYNDYQQNNILLMLHSGVKELQVLFGIHPSEVYV